MFNITACTLCPRMCKIDRTKHAGICGCADKIYVARTMLHMWEEPCISGKHGSGAVFFAGCPLRCLYCQNKEISHIDTPHTSFTELSVDELAKAFRSLEVAGAHNINLVSPTQYTPWISQAVSKAKRQGLRIPVVWNTGGYEREQTIKLLDGTVDIFLSDFKYYSPNLAGELSNAYDYPDIAIKAIEAMADILGKPVYDNNGMLKKGVVVRHLVLPGNRHDSASVLKLLNEKVGPDKIILSLMSQYTPDYFDGNCNTVLGKALKRRVTSFEYDYVSELASELGFKGYIQSRESAVREYTPDWNLR